MKLKKNISKIIALSILLNNMCFYSNANSLSRYETLEGEVIALDNVEDGDITEIEIFGNTVQDSDNLEDIQSVGDLYVDEQGEPILDESGRQQYKIDILSVGENLILDKYVNYEINPNYPNSGKTIVIKKIPVDYSKTYKIEMFNTGTESSEIYIREYYKNGNFYKTPSWGIYAGNRREYKPSDSNVYYVDIVLNLYTVGLTDDIINNFKCMMHLNSTYIGNYIQPKSNKTTILLPCQLMKIGNVADRLYWDNEKGKYIIEKNIGVQILDGNESETYGYNWSQDGTAYPVTNPEVKSLSSDIICNRFKKGSGWGNIVIYGERVNLRLQSGNIYNIVITISNDKTNGANNIVGLRDWIKDNNLYILYQSTTPELIETNITEKIKLSTYEGRSYISTITENGINPTLKLTVDRIEQTSQEAVDIALSKPIYNNITLARMFINMLPESLYKDQLQAQLNELFSEDMVLDKKSASANLDLYIKSENILIMSLDTNTITFEDFSGTEDIERPNAINITVNSSLPYQVNAYLPNEIQNTDKSNTMNKDILNIKEHSEQTYKTFLDINEKVILKDNCPAGNSINHAIDLMLKGGVAHEKDVYKTNIKFEIEQK